MTETPMFFGDDSALFGVYHQPDQPSATPFVFCHPFAEEKLWAHRVFVSYARALAEAGHPVLRFDHRGNGDSAGEFSASSLASARADVRAAITEVRHLTGAPAVDLLGLRLGATIASLVADESQDVERLVLWAPIVDGAAYMQEILRVNVTTQMAVYKEIRQDRENLVAAMREGQTVNVDGYELAYPLYSEISQVRLGAQPARHHGPTLIVRIDRQLQRPAVDLEKLASAYPQGTLTAVVEEPFWKEIQRSYQTAPKLFDATAAWLSIAATTASATRGNTR